MAGPERPGGTPAAAEPAGCWSRAGIGCVTAFAGAASGGMIGVIAGEIVGFFLRVPDCPNLPVSCNWAAWAGAGILLGAISLPALVLWRLRRTDGPNGADTGQSDRG